MERYFLTGHRVIAICTLFYIIWWAITFYPAKAENSSPFASIVLFIFTLISGLIGVNFLIKGLAMGRGGLVHGFAITGGAVLMYVILLFVSKTIFHRIVTTELALIVGWLTLEITVLNTLYGLHSMSNNILVILAIGAVAVAVVSFILYMLYYNLPVEISYYIAEIPLILIGLYSLILTFQIKMS